MIGLLYSLSEKGMTGDLETRYKTRAAGPQCSTESQEAERIGSNIVGGNLMASEDSFDMEDKEE